MAANSLPELLAHLEAAQLIRRDEGPDALAILRQGADEGPASGLTYLFKHSLTQETAYESLLLKRRREIHREVAESVERLYAENLDEFAAVLAQHYCEFGDDAKTLQYATRAGDAAMRVYANTEAVAEYSLALQAALRGEANHRESIRDLYLKRGRAMELLSQFDEAARNYEEMQQTGTGSGDRTLQLDALIALATVRAIPGSARDAGQAQALSDRALVLARELKDRPAEAKILWNLLLLNIYAGGDAERARAYGEESLAIAREFNLREQMAYTMHDLFVAYAYLGDMEKAKSMRLEARSLWRELNNQPMLAETLSGLSLLEFLLGEMDQALSLGQEAFQISKSIENLGGEGFSGYVLGLVYFERGEIAQALESIRAALPIAELGGLEGNGISPFALHALILGNLGDVPAARMMVNQTFGRPSTKLALQRMWLYAVLTRVELWGGNLGTAELAFKEGGVEATIENFGRVFPGGAVQLHFAACELAIGQNDFPRALELTQTLLGHLHKIQVLAFVPEARYLQGKALAAQGKTAEAVAAWEAARAEAKALGSRQILWRIQVALAQVHATVGNLDEADRLRREAIPVIEHIAAHAPAELRASFLNLPDVRMVLTT